jgi:hypothetical protein
MISLMHIYRIKNDQDRADVANKASTKVYDGKQLYNPWIGDEVTHKVEKTELPELIVSGS